MLRRGSCRNFEDGGFRVVSISLSLYKGGTKFYLYFGKAVRTKKALYSSPTKPYISLRVEQSSIQQVVPALDQLEDGCRHAWSIVSK